MFITHHRYVTGFALPPTGLLAGLQSAIPGRIAIPGVICDMLDGFREASRLRQELVWYCFVCE